MEIEAWEFVKQHSIISVPKTQIQKWENERIKGSWE
jgi:hypothetical protein